MRVALFYGVASLVWLAVHVYLGWRVSARMRLTAPLRRWAWGALAASGTLSLAAMVSVRIAGNGRAEAAVQWVGLLLLGVTSVLVVLVAGVDLVDLASRGLQRLAVRDPQPPADSSRRRFLGKVATMGSVGVSGGVGGLGLQQSQQTAEVVEVDVPIAGLPAPLEGYRIAQLSDIHVGPTIRRADLQAMVDRANALDADLVAITGDLVDGYVDDLQSEVAPLGELAARDGVYFVTGNHEYYWDGLAWCQEVRRQGLRVLNNEHVVVERDGARLLVAGCTDDSAGERVPAHASDPREARRGAGRCDAAVLLAHQPRSVYAAAAAGYDLQISGHTHGGQYFPMNLLVYLAQPYVAGLARHGRMWIYVSRGTGYWGPPMRVGAPQEITLLRLRAA